MANKGQKAPEQVVNMESTRAVSFVSSLTKDQSTIWTNVGSSSNPIKGEKIATTGVQNIPLEYSYTDSNGKQRKNRYIAACEVLDVDEQIKLGYDPIKKFKHDRGDTIVMNWGKLDVIPAENGHLVEFLLNHPCNGKNPNRPKGSMILFNYFDPVAEADLVFKKNKALDKATALVLSLEGNVRKQLELCTFFGLDRHLSEPEILTLLRERAIVDPNTMISAIETDNNKVAIILQQAIDSGVITFAKNKYIFQSTGDIILGFQGLHNEDKAFKKLIAHIESENGEIHLKMIENIMYDKKDEEIERNSFPK